MFPIQNSAALLSRTRQIDEASLKEKMWHELREKLIPIYPEVEERSLLLCSTCGRFLPFKSFSVEHIIPRQALEDDPAEVRADPSMPSSSRSGLTLLCNQPLILRGKTVSANGCNGFKGRWFDGALRELLNGHAINHKHGRVTENSIAALQIACYLGMFREFGYPVALTGSGAIMREQFFSPRQMIAKMPLNCQMLLGNFALTYSPEIHDLWRIPFKFTLERSSCLVVCRALAIRIPLSRDPRIPIAQHLKIVPPKYKLRPDFSTLFQ